MSVRFASHLWCFGNLFRSGQLKHHLLWLSVVLLHGNEVRAIPDKHSDQTDD
jgi:hypothetical protein